MTELRRFLYQSLQSLLPVFLLLGEGTLAYDQKTCCELAQDQSAFADPVQGPLNCGQSYDASKAPAPNAYVSYGFCKDNCSGIGLSQAKKPRQWVAPLIQFILPSVIFSMTIPRMKHVDFDFTRSPYSKWQHILASLLMQPWAVALLLVDTMIWIATIIIAAAPMMVSGLYEGLLDIRVLGWLGRDGRGREEKEYSLQFLLIVVCGNLRLQNSHPAVVADTSVPSRTLPRDTDHHLVVKATRDVSAETAGSSQHHTDRLPKLEPFRELTEELRHAEQDRRLEKLRDMMDSQMGFGSIAGAPVLFYLGAFVYTILDLLNDPSDQDAAISLAFGVEWMIIPHVAIVAGCLLASNNPSTAAAVVGKPVPGTPKKWYAKWTGWGNAYDGPYQPVYMWNRGQNKMRWIKSSTKWNESLECKQHFDVQCWQWILFILLPAFSLISLPALAGAVVAYETPPVGWGCRSLTFMIYASSQIMLASIAVIETSMQHNVGRKPVSARIRPGDWVTFALKSVLMFCSLVAAAGGTLMQIVGVFRNCICYVNASSWTPDIHQGKINVASDTREQRNSSSNWIVMGSVATGFMGLCCYIGWWYSRHIRQRFREEVRRESPFVLESSTPARDEETRANCDGCNQSSRSLLEDHCNGA
ncbi:hypothetical protein B0J12DRAFT_609813 [Macrophomina phaseolina]|uniref:Uncharacterized protein n=1 Tax=Macrophomina phaseolina TaxID=35725 RepID=A0ABQ8FWU0_9PEZI|nr:hypothetical protein B0J12DRAFT_609813 [Macrophomina phaseolina]